MPAPKIPSLFKINRHKRFEYKARFYNERKERLDNRRQEIARDLELEKKGSKIDKGFLQMKRSSAVNQSNTRVLILMVLLAAVGYLIFFR